MKKIHIFILFINLCAVCFDASAQVDDSLLNCLKTITCDTEKIDVYIRLYKANKYIDTVKAKHYLENALALSNKTKNKPCLYRIYVAFGAFYEDGGNYRLALHYYNKALYILEINNRDKKTLLKAADCLNNMGNVYYSIGNMNQSLSFYIKSLKISEAFKYKDGMANSYNNIGSIYYFEKNYKLAISYYLKSLKIKEETGNKRGIINSFNCIGNVYFSQNDFSDAILYYEKALQTCIDINDINGMETSYNNLGIVYKKSGFDEKSLAHYLYALNIDDSLNNKIGISRVCGNIASVKIYQKKYNEAILYASRSLNIAKEIGSLYSQEYAFLHLSTAYDSLKNKGEALKYYKLYVSVKDSILNDESQKNLIRMQANFESEKEIEVQSLKISQQELLLERNRILITIIILVCSVIILLLIGIILYFRQKQQRELFKQQELRTSAVILAQEQERKRIARDLHDSIGSKLTALQLNFEKTKEQMCNDKPEVRQNMATITSLLNDTHREVRDLSHQMMPKAIQEKELMEAISDLLLEIFEDTAIKYNFSYHISSNLSENISLGLYRILQELLSNIIKHSKATEIFVHLSERKNILVMMVEDNGVGISLDNKKHTKGVGLNNIEGRVSDLKGNFFIEPAPESGTIATIKIPL